MRVPIEESVLRLFKRFMAQLIQGDVMNIWWEEGSVTFVSILIAIGRLCEGGRS